MFVFMLVILLWDLSEGKKFYNLDTGVVIHLFCFSPNRYWLCAATEQSIKIWDLKSKTIVEDELYWQWQNHCGG